MKFACLAYDRQGRQVRELLDAKTKEEATEQLRKRGLFVMEIERAGAGDGPRPRRVRKRGGSARLKNVAYFAREMSVLISTGTPVVDALYALERQAKDPRWQASVVAIRERVEEGSPLSEALEACEGTFDPICRSLIAAGESSGRLEAMLGRLAVLTRQQMHTRGMVVGAMVYPALLIVVAVLVMILMILFVLPRFGGLFETLDSPLPPTTQMLMTISEVMREKWWAVFPAIGAGAVALGWWLRTDAGVRFLDTAAVRAPRFGKITRAFATARIARLMGVLLESRVSLLEALELTRQSMSNWHYVALLDRAVDGVTRGESVSNAFSGTDLVAPSVCEAMRNGEQSGRLGSVLSSVADYLDDENETTMRSLATIIEPVIMIGLGVLVGFVAISMFLPLFDLTAGAGGGV